METKQKITRKINSFTLIEVIIVVAVISLVFGLSIAYYSQFSEQKKLETEVQKLDDILHLFQKKAVTGDIYTSCSNFSGYKIQLLGNNQYNAYFCCNLNCLNPTLVKNYFLESPITFTYSSNSFSFLPLIGNINNKSNITIDISSSTKCNRLTIEPSGLITLADSCL